MMPMEEVCEEHAIGLQRTGGEMEMKKNQIEIWEVSYDAYSKNRYSK